MNNKIKIALIGVYVVTMSSCSMMDSNDYPTYPAYTYDATQLNMTQDYTVNYNYNDSQKQEVVVPDSYHVGQLHSPVSFKDRDAMWVSSQSPHGYTIELVEGDKASQVAQVLYKTPKSNRMAQVKYDRDGKTRYKGVYGTFSSAEEAQKALNSLPPEIKNSASVINWSNVQQ